MNISHYFKPLVFETQNYLSEEPSTSMAHVIHAYTDEEHFPEIEDYSLAIIGVPDDRGAVGNKGCAEAPNRVRSYLYSLAAPAKGMTIYDLGDIVPGQSIEDTYEAVTDVISQLLSNNITTIVLGGGQDITYAIYKAYEAVGRIVNISAIDPRFDIGSNSKPTSQSYLSHIIMQQPSYLFNFTSMGYQTYLVGNELIGLMDELHFGAYRLGYLQEDIRRAEPLVRNSDILTIDISAVRQSDAPANAHPSPHGLYGEQLCQIGRYAGMSDKVSCLGIFEINPIYDPNGQTAHMAAHALWYFIEGFHNRKDDAPFYILQDGKPVLQHHDCVQMLVQVESHNMDITFYKSRITDRWWMEVPIDNEERRIRYHRHLIVPCNRSDYELAMNNKVPDLLFRSFQRLMF